MCGFKPCSVAACVLLGLVASAAVPESARKAIDDELGSKGHYIADQGVYKVVLPREGATIVLDYQTLSPNFGLNSWAAFASSVHHDAMLMGQLLLLDDEVNPVFRVALSGRLNVTGLSPYAVFDGPSLHVLDVSGTGTFSELASSFRKCLDEVGRVRRASTLRGRRGIVPTPPLDSAIDADPLNAVLSMRGTVINGVYRAAIGRRVLLEGDPIGREMGISTWFCFAGHNDSAVVHGEFVEDVIALNKLLTALGTKGLDVVSIAHHIVGEHPPIVFVRFRTQGNAVAVATALRYVLDVQVGQAH